MLEIRPARLDDIHHYWAHDLRHSAESGRDGDIIFSPYEEPWLGPEEELLQEKRDKWFKPVTEIGWERCWVLADQNGIYGDLKLVHQPEMKSTLHRARLMVGIERTHRKQGWGSRFVAIALEWAREQPSLAWVELGVFTHNPAAIELYSSFGFREVGRVPDLFRVGSESIEDIQMVLPLK